MLHWVENLLPWLCDSSKSMGYFFLWFIATTSSLICDFETPLKCFGSSWKFLCSNWNHHQVLDANLDLDSSMCVYEGKYLLDLTKDSTHNSIKTLESFWIQNHLQKRHKLHSNISLKSLKTSHRVSLWCPLNIGKNGSRFRI